MEFGSPLRGSFAFMAPLHSLTRMPKRALRQAQGRLNGSAAKRNIRIRGCFPRAYEIVTNLCRPRGTRSHSLANPGLRAARFVLGYHARPSGSLFRGGKALAISSIRGWYEGGPCWRLCRNPCRRVRGPFARAYETVTKLRRPRGTRPCFLANPGLRAARFVLGYHARPSGSPFRGGRVVPTRNFRARDARLPCLWH
jgi:hypothetical protein